MKTSYFLEGKLNKELNNDNFKWTMDSDYGHKFYTNHLLGEMPFDFNVFRSYFAIVGFLSPPKLKPNHLEISHSNLKTFIS